MWKADTNINFYENLIEQKENGQIKTIEFNFSTICLLCLKNLLKNQSTINFLNTEINISPEMSQLNVSNSHAITIKEMLLNVMGKHEANFDDNYPQQICSNCLDCLRKTYFFKSQSLKTQFVLEKLLLASGKSIRNETEQRNDIQIESIDSFIDQDKSLKIEMEMGMEITDGMETIDEMPLSTSVDSSDLVDNKQQKLKKLKINKLDNEEINDIERTNVEVVEYLEYNNSFDDVDDEHIFIDNTSIDYDFIEANESNESDNDNINVEKVFEEVELINSQFDKSTAIKPVRKSTVEYSLPVIKIAKSDEKIESIFKCPGCEIILKSKNSLRNHIINQHPNSKYFNCDECERSFRTLQSLERHLKCHQNDIERKLCNYCSKSFLRADDLRRHERIHTNERPFACKWPSCNKSFKQSSELSTHLSVHLKTEFKCNFCDKIFRSRYGIYFHKKTHLPTS